VSEQVADGQKVGSLLYEIDSESVPCRVRVDSPLDACLSRKPLAQVPQIARVHLPAMERAEQRCGGGDVQFAACDEPPLDQCGRSSIDSDNPSAVVLAVLNGQPTLGEIDVLRA
jgi:hypothetical protein